MKPELRPLIPAAEARQILGGRSRQYLWELRKTGQLAGVRVGDRIYFEPAELERFITARRERRPRTLKKDDDPLAGGPSVEEHADEPGDSS